MPVPARTSLPRASYGGVLAAAVCCYTALGSVLSILPRYVPGQLHGGPTVVGAAVGAPALSGLLARPLGGRVSDRAGPRGPLVAGAGVMALAAIPAAVAATEPALLLSRLVAGAGEGVMMSATVLWLLRLAGPARRGRALGHIGLANFTGLAMGPLLAGALGGASSAAAVLWSAVPLPLLGGLAAVFLPEPSGEPENASPGASTPALLRLTGRAGAGLLLVNVGYVAVLSFGAAVARVRGTGLAGLVVPTFASVVILSRTLGGGLPDRLGGRRTVALFAGAEAAGLVVYGLAGAPGLALAALLTLSVGQSLAVPGLGLLALGRVPAGSQGAAAGLFFAWFDAGVGLGGPLVGMAASLSGAVGALLTAGAAVAGAVLIAAASRPCRREVPAARRGSEPA